MTATPTKIRAARLNAKECAILVEKLPAGSFSLYEAERALMPFSITKDQVRTVLESSPQIRRVRRGTYHRSVNGAQLALSMTDDALSNQDIIDITPSSVLVEALRRRGYEVTARKVTVEEL